MSKRYQELYLVDIFLAAHFIRRYTQGIRNGQELLHRQMHWDATIRQFEIIGEATGKLLKLGVISGDGLRFIVDFRNKIVHEYFGIDEEIVFDIIQRGLPRYLEYLHHAAPYDSEILKIALNDAAQEYRHDRETVEFLHNLSRHFQLEGLQ